MSNTLDLDRIFLLLSVAEKAALHGAQYNWISSAALDELDKIAAARKPEVSDGE